MLPETSPVVARFQTPVLLIPEVALDNYNSADLDTRPEGAELIG
jgi:hypothetical protein